MFENLKTVENLNFEKLPIENVIEIEDLWENKKVIV